jgi:HEAT repeat protein
MVFVAGTLGCGTTTASVTASVDSPHPMIRKAAVHRLGETGDMSCYDDLVVVLRRDPNRIVRSEAAFALGSLSERYYSVGFFPLVDSLENDPSVFVRSASALSLSRTRDSRAVAPLVTALHDKARGEVAMREGERVIVYRACVSDAARTSLEKIVQLRFASTAETAEAKRDEMAAKWQHMLPSNTALARK